MNFFFLVAFQLAISKRDRKMDRKFSSASTPYGAYGPYGGVFPLFPFSSAYSTHLAKLSQQNNHAPGHTSRFMTIPREEIDKENSFPRIGYSYTWMDWTMNA